MRRTFIVLRQGHACLWRLLAQAKHMANDDIGPALGHVRTAEDVCNVEHGALSHGAGGLMRGRAYHITSHGTAPHTGFGEADVTHGRAVHHPRPVNDVG
jgi:hypothetical protein